MDCGLEGADGVALAYGFDQAPVGIDRRCARSLGRAFGLDWSSFDTEPHDFEVAENDVEVVVAGLYTLISAPTLDWSTIRDQSEGSGDLMALIDEEGGDSAHERWYRYATARISRIHAAGVDEDGASMSMGGLGILSVHDLGWDDGVNGLAPLPHVVATLVHEARHTDGHPHISCPGGLTTVSTVMSTGCDADPTGAFGAGSVWASQYFWANHEQLGPEDWVTAVDAMSASCARIVDHHDFYPCDDTFSDMAAWYAR